jgi:Zn/Cd-binding protein ZinT
MNNIIPYVKGEIITILPEFLDRAYKKFKNVNVKREQKIYGFACQWQVEHDIITNMNINTVKDDKSEITDYSPFDFRIGDVYYDVKTSQKGNSITISDREITFAEKHNTTFICLKHRQDLGEDIFEYLTCITFEEILENDLLNKSNYMDGYYIFTSKL